MTSSSAFLFHEKYFLGVCLALHPYKTRTIFRTIGIHARRVLKFTWMVI